MLKNILMELNDRCENYGMKINKKKTIFNSTEFEQVDGFKYLGFNYAISVAT